MHKNIKNAVSPAYGRYILRRVAVMSPLLLGLPDFMALHPRTYFKGYAGAIDGVDLDGDLEFEVWLPTVEDNPCLPVAIPRNLVETWLGKLEAAYKAEASRRSEAVKGLAA